MSPATAQRFRSYPEFRTGSDLERWLRNEPALDPRMRRAGLEILEAYGEIEDIAMPAVWNTVRSAGAGEQACRGALDQAGRLAAVEPSRGGVLNLLGGAQYRTGRFDGAIATLTGCQETRECPPEVNTAFLAMAHWRLDHVPEARALRERIAGMLRGAQPTSDPELRNLLLEAESLIPPDPRR